MINCMWKEGKYLNTDSIVKYLDINDKMKESINILNILDEDKNLEVENEIKKLF